MAHMADRAREAGLLEVQIVAHPPSAAFYRRMGATDAGLVPATGRATWHRPLLTLAIDP